MKEKPKYKKYIGSEDSFQIAVAKYLDSIPTCLWCHVPNEGMHKIQYRVKMKAKGVKSGVPDVLIFNNNTRYCGFAIELKVGYNKKSENQEYWNIRLSTRNWAHLTTNSLDEVIEEVNNYLKIM
ncbi:MAG: VRR-NUC domain-containing protein [Bacteroidia bacterium]